MALSQYALVAILALGMIAHAVGSSGNCDCRPLVHIEGSHFFNMFRLVAMPI
jgi:hypothetical protein